MTPKTVLAFMVISSKELKKVIDYLHRNNDHKSIQDRLHPVIHRQKRLTYHKRTPTTIKAAMNIPQSHFTPLLAIDQQKSVFS